MNLVLLVYESELHNIPHVVQYLCYFFGPIISLLLLFLELDLMVGVTKILKGTRFL